MRLGSGSGLGAGPWASGSTASTWAPALDSDRGLGRRRRPPHLVATVNPEFVMRAQRGHEFARVLESADLCLADGTGVVWAARRQGCTIQRAGHRRRTSSRLWPRCARAAVSGCFCLVPLQASPPSSPRACATPAPGLEVAAHAGSPDPPIRRRDRAVDPRPPNAGPARRVTAPRSRSCGSTA